MAIRLSSELRIGLMTAYGLGVLLQGGHINLYSGTQPDSADMGPLGILLGVITQNAAAVPTEVNSPGGLQLQGGEPGELLKLGNWFITGVSAGTVGWWRWVGLGSSATGLDDEAVRLDGSAGECFLPIPITGSGTVSALGDFTLSLPTT